MGAKRCVIGIGGSATNDAGFGLARALGWKFLDRGNRELEQWWQLSQLARVTPAKSQFKIPITVAVDVLNPLLGTRGCSRVYGPQKGLRAGDMAFAEKNLRRLAVVLQQQGYIDAAKVPGAGAAGGLGFGLMAFTGARVRSGFDVFAQAAHLEQRIRSANLVITGEGALDRQTFMGKGVGQVALLCGTLKKPYLAFAGVVKEPAKSARLFSSTYSLTEITTPADAKKRTAFHLEELTRLCLGKMS